MRRIPEHLERVRRATDLYVAAYNERRVMIIEARNDGCTIDELAEASKLAPAAVAAILGEEL